MTELAHSIVTTRFPAKADLEASKIRELATLINAVYDEVWAASR